MKIKSLFSVSILAIASTACTSDEVVSTPKSTETAISFNAITNNMTRAANSFCSQDKPTKFFVAAFLDSQNYFEPSIPNYCDAITYNDPSWNSMFDRYWPKYNALDFYACLDGGETLATGSTFTAGENGIGAFEVKINDYAIDTDITNQRDLMYAITKDAKQSDNNGTVTLNFLHALSQICFQATNVDSNTEFEITNVQVSNIFGKGTFTFGDTSTTQGHNEHSGDYTTTNQGSWVVDNTSEQATYSLNLSNCKLEKYTGNEQKTNISNLSYNGSIPHEISEDVYNTCKSRAMNLLPQKGEAKITVSFKANGSNDISTEELQVNIDWEQGRRYVYNLIFSAGGKITYSTTIADFVSENKDIPEQK